MNTTYVKPAMRAMDFECGELLSVSGKGISYGGIDGGQNVPGARTIDLDDEDEDWD